MLANVPLHQSAMTSVHTAQQTNWTPPLQHEAAHTSMGLPDLTTAPKAAQKEWTNDACVTVALLTDTITCAFWNERKGTVKNVVTDKSKRTPNVVAVPKDASSLKYPIEGLVLGKEAVKLQQNVGANASHVVVYPLQVLSGVSHKKNSGVVTADTQVMLTDAAHVDAKVLLAHVVASAAQSCVAAYNAEVGEGSTETKITKPTSKKAKSKQSLTVVIPSFSGCAYRHRVVESVALAGAPVHNVFGGALAVTCGALFRSQGSAAAGLTQILELKARNSALVLYVHASIYCLDVALVQCDGGAAAKETGNRLGYQRLNTVAVAGEFLSGGESKDLIIDRLVQHIRGVVSLAADAASVEAVLVDGISEVITAALTKAAVSLPSIEVLDGDASQGGCVLTAGECDSSKEYLQDGDGNWFISYSLPVGDEVLAYDVGLYTLTSGEASRSDVSDDRVETVFAAGTRISKTDLGPLIPGKTNPVKEVVKTFKCASLYQSSGSSAAEYPKVVVVEKIRGTWTQVLELSPLSSSRGAVTEATLTLKLNTSMGSVQAIEKKGESVASARSSHWGWLKVLVGVLAVLLLIGGGVVYQQMRARAEVLSHEAWLREFYQLHAPEKLNEADVVSRTIKKYEGKLFLLWRKLEKTYKVKWRAPDSIKEL